MLVGRLALLLKQLHSSLDPVPVLCFVFSLFLLDKFTKDGKISLKVRVFFSEFLRSHVLLLGQRHHHLRIRFKMGSDGGFSVDSNRSFGAIAVAAASASATTERSASSPPPPSSPSPPPPPPSSVSTSRTTIERASVASERRRASAVAPAAAPSSCCHAPPPCFR